jgi:hypothetical protein
MASMEDLLALNGFEVEKETSKTKKQVEKKSFVKKPKAKEVPMYDEDDEDDDEDEDLGV